MAHWKTTLGGILGAVSVPFMASDDPRFHYAGMALAMVATTWLGFHSTDRK